MLEHSPVSLRRYYGVDPSQHVLTDESGCRWPGHALVLPSLRSAMCDGDAALPGVVLEEAPSADRGPHSVTSVAEGAAGGHTHALATAVIVEDLVHSVAAAALSPEGREGRHGDQGPELSCVATATLCPAHALWSVSPSSPLSLLPCECANVSRFVVA